MFAFLTAKYWIKRDEFHYNFAKTFKLIVIPSLLLYKGKILSKIKFFPLKMYTTKITKKVNLEDLFGSWSEVTDKQLKEIKASWRGWNEKIIRRF